MSAQPSPANFAPRPFLKWAGGKRRLADEIAPDLAEHLTRTGGRYFEPFLGGGAMFFAMRKAGWAGVAVLSDANRELAACYAAVRAHPAHLMLSLETMARLYAKDGADYYYAVRATWNKTGIAAAARLIFLNRTCFNGLYRVNKHGHFNVPHGASKTPPVICDRDVILAAAHALAGTEIYAGDFAEQAAYAQRGDVVYFDPPYEPVSSTANFRAYTASGFGPEHQVRLAALARTLKKRGVKVVLSAADTPQARALYGDKGSPFAIRNVEARRSINSQSTRRGPVGELVIT